jgi:hypothetical protein
MAVLALTVGTTGVAVAQTEATEDASPAAVSESSTTSFPTGYFVSVETGRVMLEFHGDGFGMAHSLGQGSTAPFSYAVDGDVYTAVKGGSAVKVVESEQVSSATYRWDHDGERLAFELIGEDIDSRRKSLLSEYTFRSIEDPQVVMVASSDLDVGDPVRAWDAFVAAAGIGPDVYTNKTEYLGHVAAVPISKGQPITPDLVEPRPE